VVNGRGSGESPEIEEVIMRNNTRALLIATVAALVGFGLLYVYKQRIDDAASGGAPVSVLTARHDLELGARLEAEDLGFRQIPSAYVEERHVRRSDLEKVVGVRLSMGVRQDEPLLWTDLATNNDQRRDLSSLVRPGMRALAIRADTSSGFGGLLRPGDRVDVLLTAERGEDDERVTLSLLQNVLVLAVGTDTGAARAARPGEVHRTRHQNEVTLSVTVEQAQLVTYARDSGELALALRNPDDVRVQSDLPETSHQDVIEADRRAAVAQHEPSRNRRRRPRAERLQTREEAPRVPRRID
jgi:pilus assembly protein CpaB